MSACTCLLQALYIAFTRPVTQWASPFASLYTRDNDVAFVKLLWGLFIFFDAFNTLKLSTDSFDNLNVGVLVFVEFFRYSVP